MLDFHPKMSHAAVVFSLFSFAYSSSIASLEGRGEYKYCAHLVRSFYGGLLGGWHASRQGPPDTATEGLFCSAEYVSSLHWRRRGRDGKSSHALFVCFFKGRYGLLNAQHTMPSGFIRKLKVSILAISNRKLTRIARSVLRLRPLPPPRAETTAAFAWARRLRPRPWPPSAAERRPKRATSTGCCRAGGAGRRRLPARRRPRLLRLLRRCPRARRLWRTPLPTQTWHPAASQSQS